MCVDGPSGAGKTTWAHTFAAELGGARVLGMDELYPGWDGLAAGVTELLTHVVDPLVAGRPACYRRWDWQHDRPGDRVELGRPDLLVVEGVGAGAARAHAVLTVWLDAPADVRRHRAIARDGDTFAPHWERWARQEHAHFEHARTREHADVLIRTG